ncbi:MAG: apolipoprotein N-acyltransferase [Candidatus Nanopelagicales bacterium]
MPEPADASVRARLLLRVLGSVGGGLLLVLSFPPYDVVWLAPPALAAMTLSWHGVRARRGFWLGLLAGAAFLLWHLHWMTVIGDDAWLMLGLAFALFYGLIGAGVAATSSLRVWPLAVPLMWVAVEALRGRVPFGGFPWGDLAFGQTSTTLTPYAALGGAPLVSFAIALVGSLLAYAWTVRDRPRAAVGTLVAVAIVCTAGGLVPLPVEGETAGGPAYSTAAVVQGNVAGPGMDAFGDTRALVLSNHVRETERLAADVRAGRSPQPDLVIWPENASDLDPYANPDARQAIQQAADAIGAPVLVGAVVTKPDDPTHIWNVGIVWQPASGGQGGGPTSFYVKQHPVPFGEWVPFRDVLAKVISRFDRVPRDFAAGDSTGVLQVGPALVGDLICFEVAYDDLSRNAVRGDGVTGPLAGEGARILAVQTNNATYGLTGQPEQQMAMSRLRAVEHGRGVLVAATSGISAIVAPDGTIEQQLPEFVAGHLVAKVPLRDTLTVADRLGALPVLVAVAGALGLLAVVLVRSRRRRDVGFMESRPSEESLP